MSTPPATRWRLLNLGQALDEPEASLRARACREIGLDPGRLRGFRIARRALDARRSRGGMRFVCHVDLVLDAGREPARLRRAVRSGRVQPAPDEGALALESVDPERRARHWVVVGTGPAGIFAASVLARSGARVTMLDRGPRIEERGPRVVAFHRGAPPDPEANLLFGEGGAGTYSDGKLYTRVDDPLEVPILEELVACGAPADILFDSRAHIGTDRLHRILPRLRARLEAFGVEFRFDVRLDGLMTEPGPPTRVRALRTTAGELGCDGLILATGHSARDTWSALADAGLTFEAKPFQFGVRVEHPQELITAGRYGTGPEAELLGPASYTLVCKAGEGLAAAHSFCMCPGGRIVATVNEPGLLCTNGMSNSTHSSRWANAALVMTVGPEAFAEFGSGPFAGVAFQRHFEARFFAAGGSSYAAPAQLVPDFLAGAETRGELRTSYRFGAVPGRVDTLLPASVRDGLRRALARFDRAIPGFAGPEGLLVGVESRSSGPVRMPREDSTRVALGFENVYPVGEGAGYAGGIMSAALDGARSARLALNPAGARSTP
ncbi:MAG: NAD(P)-binding protein [bacterium]|nr:NAD(P)-binding protein [bacterium]